MATTTKSTEADGLDEVPVERPAESADAERVPDDALFFRMARLLFGAVLVATGLNHFQQTEGMVQYADAKGVPNAETMVPLSGGLLVFSGLGIAFWRVPKLAAGAAATFLAAVTPTMHDFWNADEDDRQDEMNAFLKNVAMLGGAFAFLVRGGQS